MRRYNPSYYNHASITQVRIITHPGMASAVFQALVMTAVRTLPIVGALSALPAWCRHPILLKIQNKGIQKRATHREWSARLPKYQGVKLKPKNFLCKIFLSFLIF